MKKQITLSDGTRLRAQSTGNPNGFKVTVERDGERRVYQLRILTLTEAMCEACNRFDEDLAREEGWLNAGRPEK